MTFIWSFYAFVCLYPSASTQKQNFGVVKMLYLLVMNCHMPLVLVRELDVSKLYEFYTYDTVQSDIAIICTEAMKTLSFDLQIVLTEKNMTIIGDNMLLFYSREYLSP